MRFYDWPEGYWPLHLRLVCPNTKGKKTRAAPGPVGIRRADWKDVTYLDYDTKEPVSEVVVKDREGVVSLLAPAGEYYFGFWLQGKKREPGSAEWLVDDPFAEAHEVPFRDGRPILIRPGRWDKFILKEKPYGALPIVPGSTVLDGGGHIGTFARDAVAAGAGRVVSYEPDHVNHEFHRRNTEGLPVERVCAALGTENGEATFHLNLVGKGGGNALHTLYKRSASYPKVTVPVESLADACVRTGATSIKLDVEGAEEWYDYSSLPDTVRYIAVEFKKGFVESKILQAGFTDVIQQPTYKGYSSTGVWGRP